MGTDTEQVTEVALR